MIQSLMNSFQSVCILFLLISLGYYCTAKKWMNKETKSFLSKFIMQIAIPFMCIYSFRTRLTRDAIFEAGPLLLVPFLNISLTFIIAYLIAKAVHMDRKTFGPFMMMAGISNTMLVGVPMCTELFGQESVPYAVMYYMVSTCFTQCLAMTLVSWSGESGTKRDFRYVLKKIVTTPAIIGIVCGAIIVLADFQPPELFMSFSKYMNQVVIPMGMLINGQIIYEIGLKNLKISRDLLIMLCIRFVMCPALCLIFCKIFGVTGLPMGVFIIEAAMPTASTTSVAAAEYGANEEIAAQGTAITTLLSFIVIPVLMLLLG